MKCKVGIVFCLLMAGLWFLFFYGDRGKSFDREAVSQWDSFEGFISGWDMAGSRDSAAGEIICSFVEKYIKQERVIGDVGDYAKGMKIAPSNRLRLYKDGIVVLYVFHYASSPYGAVEVHGLGRIDIKTPHEGQEIRDWFMQLDELNNESRNEEGDD